MGIPLTFVNRVANPNTTPNGLGAETRRNLVLNPVMNPSTSPVQIRTNEVGNPSFQNASFFNQWSTGAVAVTYSTSTGVTAGTRSCQVTPNAGNNDSFIAWGDAPSRQFGSFANGSQFSVSADITIGAVQTGTLSTRARRIVVFTKNSSSGYTEYSSAQAPNTPGTYRLNVTATIATGTGVELFVRFYNGSSNASQAVYWDAVQVQPTAMDAFGLGFFDGSTAMDPNNEGDMTSVWAGTPHASNSSLRVYSVDGMTPTAGCYARRASLRSFTGGTSMAVGWSASSATTVAGVEHSVTLPAATQYTFSTYWYRPTSATQVALRATGPGMTTVNGSAFGTIGAWVRGSITFTTVTAGTYVLSLRNSGAVTAATPAGQTDGWQLETGATATSFFYGGTAAANLSYSWTGTANNSASTETGQLMPFYTEVNATMTSSLQSGKTKLALIPLSASLDSKVYPDNGPGAMRMGMVAGKSYYLSARLQQLGALVGTPHASNLRNITVYYRVGAGTVQEIKTTPSTNAAGTYTHSLFFTIPADATEAYVSLNHGYPTGGGTVYWDNVMLTDSQYGKTIAYLGRFSDLNQTTSSANGTEGVSGSIPDVSLSVTAPNANENSFVNWQGSAPANPLFAHNMVPGRSYAITGDIRIQGTIQSGTVSASARRIQVEIVTPTGSTFVQSPQAANTANTTTSVTTGNFTVPSNATAVKVYLWNGARTTFGTPVLFNNLRVLDNSLTDYSASYFDGDTTPTNSESRVTRWTGQANASTSEFNFRGLWVEANTAVSPPRTILTAAGLGLNRVSAVTIKRKAGSDTMIVPGWGKRNILDIGTGTDYLVPLNTPVEYQLWVDGSQIDSETITYTSPCGWIADPLAPTGALPVWTVPTGSALTLQKSAMASKSHTSEGEMSTVIGSSYPVVRAGQRQLLSNLTLPLNAPTNATSDALYEILKVTPILCIRTHPSWGNMPPVVYLHVAEAVEKPLNRQTGGQFTQWDLSGPAVAPVTRGPIVAAVTHAEVQAALSGRTHQSIKNVSSNKRWVEIETDPLSLGG